MSHSDRLFPRPCSDCGKIEVLPSTIAYETDVKHDGRLHHIHIPCLKVLQCGSCQEVFFDSQTDDQISQALREALSLLSPKEIHDRLAFLGLTQRAFAEQIRVAEATVSRWLSGAYIQSASSDVLMRMFFEREEAKRAANSISPVTIPDGELSPWPWTASPYSVWPTITATPLRFDNVLAELPLDLAA